MMSRIHGSFDSDPDDSLPGRDGRDWDAEHANGCWAFLASPAEQARLSVVAGLAALAGAGAVVDVGCASGLLRRWLDRDRFPFYLGVDIAAAAFAGARAVEGRGPVEDRFVASAIEDFRPEAPLPGCVVVFSEVLYYLDRPVAHLARLCRALGAASAVVSVTEPGDRHRAHVGRVATLWRDIEALGWPVAADLDLADRRGGERWRITALQAGTTRG